MNADAHMNLLGFLLLGITRLQLLLDLLGALHGMDDRGKVDQEGVPNCFDDMTVMDPHRLLDDLIVHF
jgi:hypothetical protein